ncbi:MAG: acyl-CoA dehydratase activase [Planctomycetota bacterium]|jgi:predicted CoA-substrate-specific enzyme activase
MDRTLGVDLGSQYAAAVLADAQGKILQSAYEHHQGDLVGALSRALAAIDLPTVRAFALTGLGADRVKGWGSAIDPMVALVEGAKLCFPSAKNIFYIGAGSYSLVRLNERGEYLGHVTNTACASGTGAFLDQQAMRLGFKAAELADRASCAQRCPSVATRCAVFAKTDMIHLQQDGYTPEEIAAGLCDSLGQATVQMLLKGRKLKGTTVLCGGVARNQKVRDAMERKLDFPLEVPDHPELLLALGAAILASQSSATGPPDLNKLSSAQTGEGEGHRQPELALRLSDYPDFTYHEFKIDDQGTEVAVPEPFEKGQVIEVMLGIDIGSTSTKALMMNRDRKVVALAYRATAGDPIRATQRVFRALLDLADQHGVRFEVAGAGTTGSGRKMIRAVLGAELEKDEITAHARAATFIDPAVDTILEIGGQDSKFTQLEEGVVVNSVMNYVCAAGTGSFIEEQAKSLGVSIWDYADFVLGSAAPRTSDRCTVFMERDLKERLAEGCSRQEAAAATLYSVRDNYMNKVVNGLPIGNRVYFQGATARNKALIAAFEQELEKPILVSPYCHLTGAMGIALMLLSDPPKTRTFRGLAFADTAVETTQESCSLCNNNCNLTIIRTGGETVAWGLKCGREYHETKPRKEDRSRYTLFANRHKRLFASPAPSGAPLARIGIPRALTAFGYFPLWREVFRELGIELVLSPRSSEPIMDAGREQMTAEFCAPFVMNLGHVSHLLDAGVDAFFLPVMVREHKPEGLSDSQFCCFIQASPAVARATEAAHAVHPSPRIISPVIELSLAPRKIARNLHRSLKDAGYPFPFRRVHRALKKGLEALQGFHAQLRQEGMETLQQLKGSGEMGVVIMGRPYNVNDPGLNLDLPRKIASMGVTPFPMDALPSGPDDLGHPWENMYWAYGQRIIAAAEYVARSKNLFGILFTNFGCGPDSYLVTYFKTIMGAHRKPYLILQFDAHGADAGYMTRVEAAIESFRAWKPRESPPLKRRARGAVSKERTVLFPPMDPITVHTFVSSFRGHGFKAEVLEENATTLAVGNKHCGGGECAPCPSTMGSMIHYLETTRKRPEEVAFFMPTASGPCRFGQYQRLSEIVFDRKGWEELLVLSPSGVNTYQGLSPSLRRQLWDAVVVGDILQKIVFRLRPYERRVGEVDRTLWESIHDICKDFEARRDPVDSLGRAVKAFSAIPVDPNPRPKVGVVGEIYLRTNHFLNEDLFRIIERLGGEVWKATLAEWFHYTAYLEKHASRGGKNRWMGKLNGYINNWFFDSHENKYYSIADSLIGDRHEPPIEKIVAAGSRYVPVEFEGEAVLTLGRALLFFQRDGVDAVVNASPTFCMPGTITTSLFSRIEEEVGKPIICLFYDGSGNPNQALVPHMHYLKSRHQHRVRETGSPRSTEPSATSCSD